MDTVFRFPWWYGPLILVIVFGPLLTLALALAVFVRYRRRVPWWMVILLALPLAIPGVGAVFWHVQSGAAVGLAAVWPWLVGYVTVTALTLALLAGAMRPLQIGASVLTGARLSMAIGILAVSVIGVLVAQLIRIDAERQIQIARQSSQAASNAALGSALSAKTLAAFQADTPLYPGLSPPAATDVTMASDNPAKAEIQLDAYLGGATPQSVVDAYTATLKTKGWESLRSRKDGETASQWLALATPTKECLFLFGASYRGGTILTVVYDYHSVPAFR